MGVMFGAIWSGVKAVFGSTGGNKGADNVMTVTKGIGNWIDGQQFTEQERAEMRGKFVEQYGLFIGATVGENSERSITRRNLAIWIIRVELLLLVVSAVMHKFDPAWAEYVYQICTDSPLGLLTLGVGAFFFGTHLVRAAKGG